MCSFDTVLSIFDMTPLGSLEYFKNTWCILKSWTVATVDVEVNAMAYKKNRAAPYQWRNRGVSGVQGGQSAPRDFWPGNFCWPTGKKEAREKGVKIENWLRIENKRRKIVREGGKLKMESGKVTKCGKDFFFFFACHFSKLLKFVLGLPKWKFSTEKKFFMPGKKSGKMTLAPQKDFPVTPPVPYLCTVHISCMCLWNYITIHFGVFENLTGFKNIRIFRYP